MFRRTAHLYDLIYEASGKDYAAESSVVASLIRARHPAARTLLDVACGTGAHLRHLRDEFAVGGVDLDPEMLAVARQRLPEVALVEGDMRTLALGRTFDAVVCLFSSIGYMRDDEELAAAIAAMAKHLGPGGVLIVDGWVRPDAWLEGGSTSLDVAESEHLKVARVGRSRRVGSTTYLEMHHLVASPDGVEYLVDHHEMSLFSPEQYLGAFERADLVVEVVDSPMPGRDRYVGTKAAAAAEPVSE